MLEEKRLPVPLYVNRSHSTAALAEAMARSGRIVLELDPRDSPAANEGRPFLGNWVTNERAESRRAEPRRHARSRYSRRRGRAGGALRRRLLLRFADTPKA